MIKSNQLFSAGDYILKELLPYLYIVFKQKTDSLYFQRQRGKALGYAVFAKESGSWSKSKIVFLNKNSYSASLHLK